MTKKTVKRAAVDVAKELSFDVTREVTLHTGVRAILKPVAASLFDEVVGRVEYPKVPIWMNEDKGREEPNPNDPDYINAVKQADRRKGIVAIDALVMFGVELVDGVPDDGWDKKLKYLEKRGAIDISDFDLEDEDDREFVFKRYIAMGADDLGIVASLSGLREEDVAEAVKSFRGS